MLSKEFKNVSLSHATMRTQDLIPVFMDFLKTNANDKYLKIIKDNNLIEDFFWPDDEHEYWEAEDTVYFLNEDLFNILNEIAPEDCYFGSHIGNGSDYGFWEAEDSDDIPY